MDGKVERRMNMKSRIKGKPTHNKCIECPWKFLSSVAERPSCSFVDGDPKYLSDLSSCPGSGEPMDSVPIRKKTPATFTQGEWAAKGYNVVDTNGNSIATTGTSSARKYAEDIANAQLIASAPDMLKALKQASAYCDLRENGEGGLSVQEIVDNAIAKAEGVQ
jgi:hypothetical protein